MKCIEASQMDYRVLNEQIREADEPCRITGCLGQRFIGAGLKEGEITLADGVPGNALGAYLNGASIFVEGNAQDAVGDTMNDGSIVICGNVGDTAGYAMRGGTIYVKGNAGYRAGIHMKAYRDKVPVMVIGGCAGSFLGEYQAGGVLVVLGLGDPESPIVGDFPCTGMHGGKLILRAECGSVRFPDQVTARQATEEDREEIRRYVSGFAKAFHMKEQEILDSPYTVVTPDSRNPYKRLYVAN